MYQIPLIGNDDQIVRTQITLTETLKNMIEQQGNLSGESLSAYLRRAALTQLILDLQTKNDSKALASRVIGAINLKNHPEWETKGKVTKWQRKIRSEWTN